MSRGMAANGMGEAKDAFLALMRHHKLVMTLLMESVHLVIVARKDPSSVATRVERLVSHINASLPEVHNAWTGVLFDGEVVLVDGQAFAADRELYGRALKIVKALTRLNIYEIQFQLPLTPHDIERFLQYLQRQEPLGSVEQRLSPRLRVRGRNASILLGFEGSVDTQEVCARGCALAVVVMEAFYADALVGDHAMLSQVKRVAQNLIVLQERYPRMSLAMLGAQPSRRDSAMLAVKSAVLSLMMLRRLTRDMRNLMDLAMSALLMDLSVLHLVRLEHPVVSTYRDEALFRQWIDAPPPEVADRLPMAGAAMMSLLGEMNESSMTRAVYAYETLALERSGATFDGETIEAMVLCLSRAFIRQLAPEPHPKKPVVPIQLDVPIETSRGQKSQVDEALTRLSQMCQGSRVMEQLFDVLRDVTGLMVRGEKVVLSSGYRAVVLANHERPSCFARPVVRLVRGADGEVLDPPQDVDLSLPEASSVLLGGVERAFLERDEALEHVAQQMVTPATKKPSVRLLDALGKKKKKKKRSSLEAPQDPIARISAARVTERVKDPFSPGAAGWHDVARLDEQESEEEDTFDDAVTQVRKAPILPPKMELQVGSFVDEEPAIPATQGASQRDALNSSELAEYDQLDATQDNMEAVVQSGGLLSWDDEDTGMHHASMPSDRIQMLHASDIAHMVPEELLEELDATQENARPPQPMHASDFSIAPFLRKPSEPDTQATPSSPEALPAQQVIEEDVTIEHVPRQALSASSIMSLDAFTSRTSAREGAPSFGDRAHAEAEIEEILASAMSMHPETWNDLHKELEDESLISDTSTSDRLIVLSASQSEAILDSDDDEPLDTALLPAGVVESLMRRDRRRHEFGTSLLDEDSSSPSSEEKDGQG